ncbi:negative regulator of sigma E activity [Natronospira proteinivora]|uniref:Negative regulator of sigma E activity n=1 Tax=Natronospira proteinivora TaxID=1807133 RepID=A0ABT1G5U8_9GAMM|nr:sigma-E factor negative regulatory protein [Natronospira proteinivora]MCP1726669.1 negative regulator of sigma E activity [Natronospira proteinivora]
MTDKLREQLSALVDGELDEGEAKLLVRRFERDNSLKEVWDRYQRCAQLLNVTDHAGEDIAVVDQSFTEGVMEAIAEEPGKPVPSSWWQEWLKPVAGVAVAAGVATVALVGMQGGQFADDPESVEVVPAAGVESSPWSSPARISPAAAGRSLEIDQAESWQRLNHYRLNHTDHAAGVQRLDAEEADSEAGMEDEPERIQRSRDQ